MHNILIRLRNSQYSGFGFFAFHFTVEVVAEVSENEDFVA